MRLTEEEFWRLTPSQFDALRERWVEQQQREELRTATLTSLVANLFLKPGRKPFRPLDFMLFKGDAVRDGGQRQKANWQKQLQQVQMLNQAFGGKDIRKVKSNGNN